MNTDELFTVNKPVWSGGYFAGSYYIRLSLQLTRGGRPVPGWCELRVSEEMLTTDWSSGRGQWRWALKTLEYEVAQQLVRMIFKPGFEEER